MKIVSTGATLASEKFLEKKRRARKRKLTIFFSILVTLFIGAIFLLRSSVFRVRDVVVSGNEVIQSEDVSEGVMEILSGHYLYLIPKDSAFFYRSTAIKEGLQRKFPRFSLVEVSLSGLHTLDISVVEREPFAIYCETLSVSPCYFIDDTGFIFDAAPIFSEGVYLVYTQDVPLESPKDKEFMQRDEFWELNEFISSLDRLQLEISTIEVGDRDITMNSKAGIEVLLRRDSNLGLTQANLEAFLSAQEIKSDPDFWNNVVRLDLRTENKVFYSFQQ